ncbi:hypothetical protein BGX28_008831 [Mortierella sp. GBA30]|nr:hypothetical protein BGX28_008831 [Mortierella sp. GBA30]
MESVRIKKEVDNAPRIKTEPTTADTIQSLSANDENGDEESEDDEEDVFEVEKVVGHKREAEGLYYYIQWKGYQDSDNTWEPENSVFCHGLIKEYWERHLQRGGRRTDVSGMDSKPGAKRKSSLSAGNARSASAGASRRATSQEPLLPDLSKVLEPASIPSTSIKANKEVTRNENKEAAPAKRQKTSSSQGPSTDIRKDIDSTQPWRPPVAWESWEERVEKVEAIERRPSALGSNTPSLVVHLRWKDGKESEHTNDEVRKRCPQILLDFLEANLHFKEGPADEHASSRRSDGGHL